VLPSFRAWVKVGGACAPHKTSGRRRQLLNGGPCLLFVPIFAGKIILRHLMPANFFLISVPGVFHAVTTSAPNAFPFLEQLADTLRIRTPDPEQSLQFSRLPSVDFL
jgi:hypothetical protein